MKQGTGHSTDSARKVEPTSRGMNVGRVADIGLQVVHTRPEPMHERGFTAPKPKSTTCHHCGSQGKY